MDWSRNLIVQILSLEGKIIIIEKRFTIKQIYSTWSWLTVIQVIYYKIVLFDRSRSVCECFKFQIIRFQTAEKIVFVLAVIMIVPTAQPTSLSLILTKDRRDDVWPEDENRKIRNVCKRNMLMQTSLFDSFLNKVFLKWSSS